MSGTHQLLVHDDDDDNKNILGESINTTNTNTEALLEGVGWLA